VDSSQSELYVARWEQHVSHYRLAESGATPPVRDGSGSELLCAGSPASVYYEKCVAPARKAHVPDERYDGLITDGLTGIIIGQFNQEHPAFCLPERLEHQTQARSLSAIAKLEAKMRAAVAGYMREHLERLSDGLPAKNGDASS
jgi:hypothetical protein